MLFPFYITLSSMCSSKDDQRHRREFITNLYKILHIIILCFVGLLPEDISNMG